jgi:hypothetical protein
MSRIRSSPATELDACRDDRAWEAKLASDRARAARNQTRAQQRITEQLLKRSQAAGAEAFALTGSTARNQRTEISDLDFHVVGRRPRYDDLPDDVDIYAGDAEQFWTKLRSGDDFVQWTLRFGCLLFDTGIFRAGLQAIVTEGLWPDPQVKFARLPAHVNLASRLIRMGDRDAAQAEVRAALTTAARGILLEARVFPLARSELSDQLHCIGYERLGQALHATIHSERSLAELDSDLSALELAPVATAAAVHPA